MFKDYYDFITFNFQLSMTFDSQTGLVSLTVAELASAIASALKEVKIYVLESEISAAQNAVKAVVEQANIHE